MARARTCKHICSARAQRLPMLRSTLLALLAAVCVCSTQASRLPPDPGERAPHQIDGELHRADESADQLRNLQDITHNAVQAAEQTNPIHANSTAGQGSNLPPEWPPGALDASPLPNLDDLVLERGHSVDKPMLLIGVLSSARTIRRRDTVEGTWLEFVKHTPTRSVLVNFVLARNEVSAEQLDSEDVLVVDASVSYSSILLKVIAVLQRAVELEARWLLKTDDDAYINVPQVLLNVLALCTTRECDREKMYVGSFMTGAGVMTHERHRWYNGEYLNHTKVSTYLPYALGGGYIVSLDIAQVLTTLRKSVNLTYMPIEDAALGMWLAGMNVTRLNWEIAMLSIGWPCCFMRSMSVTEVNEVLGRYFLVQDPCHLFHVGQGLHVVPDSQLGNATTEGHEQEDELPARNDQFWRRRLQRMMPGNMRGEEGSEHGTNAQYSTSGSGGEASWSSGQEGVSGDAEGSTDEGYTGSMGPGASQAWSRGVDRLELRQAILASRNTPELQKLTLMDSRSSGWGGKRTDFEQENRWLSRRMVLHKVSNPLHMYYLHWRLRHCDIPVHDLLHPLAAHSAKTALPTLAELLRPRVVSDAKATQEFAAQNPPPGAQDLVSRGAR